MADAPQSVPVTKRRHWEHRASSTLCKQANISRDLERLWQESAHALQDVAQSLQRPRSMLRDSPRRAGSRARMPRVSVAVLQGVDGIGDEGDHGGSGGLEERGGAVLERRRRLAAYDQGRLGRSRVSRQGALHHFVGFLDPPWFLNACFDVPVILLECPGFSRLSSMSRSCLDFAHACVF